MGTGWECGNFPRTVSFWIRTQTPSLAAVLFLCNWQWEAKVIFPSLHLFLCQNAQDTPWQEHTCLYTNTWTILFSPIACGSVRHSEDLFSLNFSFLINTMLPLLYLASGEGLVPLPLLYSPNAIGTIPTRHGWYYLTKTSPIAVTLSLMLTPHDKIHESPWQEVMHSLSVSPTGLLRQTQHNSSQGKLSHSAFCIFHRRHVLWGVIFPSLLLFLCQNARDVPWQEVMHSLLSPLCSWSPSRHS